MALAEARRVDATSLTEKLRDFSAKYVKISDVDKTRTRTLVNDYIENQIIEFCRQKSELQILNLQYTGSFYERLKTEAADEVDIMVVLGTPSSEIHGQKSVTVSGLKRGLVYPKKFLLRMRSCIRLHTAVPGYVRLRAGDDPIFCKYSGHEGYLDPRSFRDRWFRSIIQRAVNNIKPKAPFSDVRLVVRTHGPAVLVDILGKDLKRSYYQLISSLASMSGIAGMCPGLLKGKDLFSVTRVFGASRFPWRRSKYSRAWTRKTMAVGTSFFES